MIKLCEYAADPVSVLRTAALLSLLAALATTGYLLAAQSHSNGPASRAASTAIAAAEQAAVGINLQQAAAALEQARALNGTYAGADLGGFGVTLVHADPAAYCIQAGSGTALYHEAGPDGAPAPGPC